MNENKREFKMNYGDQEIIVETGRLAKQADGSVLVTAGGTQVLVTVCSAREIKDDQDFFPLSVEYVEKFYAAGKFLGGFMKREARPTTKETLCARLIDRPIRPCFPEGYMAETVVVATVLSYEPSGDPEVLASLGASAAISISDIPFNGPTGTVKVGRIDGKFKINLHYDEWAKSDIELVVSGSKDAILMVEGECHLISEKEMLEALRFGHEHIKQYCAMVEQMQKEVGKPKREFVSSSANVNLVKKIHSTFSAAAEKALAISPKLERALAMKNVEHQIRDAIAKDPASFGVDADADCKKLAAKGAEELFYKMMRADILEKEKRIAGRKLDEVRKIETETNVLRQPHGSALFTRGETQVLSTVTIGGSQGDQMVDNIKGLSYDKFYLHYNFPGYSVGEAKAKFSVGRRELGHGNLAERAIKRVMPDASKFPYTVRVACEVLESNGSSSMGSVCAGCMALLDAGVPLNAPVAGIAMGLISDGKKYKILTDILGDEDHLGDMDFKVAGTDGGISAIQMDIKIAGLTFDIIEEALERARKGRLHILGEMSKTISTQRSELKSNVPRIESLKIMPDQIGMLIGPGGKNIKKLQENYAVTIECDDDGTVRVLGSDAKKIVECVNLVKLQLNGPELGSVYHGEVVTIKEYGAFVDIAPGVSGLVHISELSDERVKDVYDYLSEGDMVDVKVLEIDRTGRVKLSVKAVRPIPPKAKK